MKEMFEDSYYRSSIYRSNQTVEWCPSDSSFNWKENCRKYSNNKSLKYYKENPIEYSFNNYGFRTPDDFNDTDEGNIFLGDSNTFGIGHLLENTWSYKLNKDLGGKFWNLSQGGSGIQSSYRLLGGFKDRLKIKNIYHLALHHPRFEFIYEGNVVKLSPWTIDLLVRNDKVKFDKPTVIEYFQDGEKKSTKVYSFKEFYVNILSNQDYINYIHDGYIYAIKGLTQEIGCNYYYLTGFDIFKEYSVESYGTRGSKSWGFGPKTGPHSPTRGRHPDDNSLEARDLKHYTVGQQNFIYKQFKELIKGEKNG
jgi:hypothetical protein